MSEQQRPRLRGTADPLVRALAAAIREIAERRAAGDAQRRRTLTVISDKEDRAA